jgi:hypothetical protein
MQNDFIWKEIVGILPIVHSIVSWMLEMIEGSIKTHLATKIFNLPF